MDKIGRIHLSGCIVLYKDDRQVLLDAIRSFLNTTLKVKLYLVDNSPTNELKDIWLDPRIEYIHNPENPGFGAAHNIAIKKAFKDNTDYHLVLNPDIYFEGPVLEQIVRYMDQHSRIGNLMPKVTYPDGSNQYLCKLLPTPYDWIGRRFNPFKSLVDKRNRTFELQFSGYDKIMEVPYLSGCFMFLRLSALKEIGLFDENIFMYGEEVDLCRRLIHNGYETIYYPEASVVHHFQKGSHKSFKLTWVGMKSAVYYFNKWGWLFDSERGKINRETLNKLASKHSLTANNSK
jgi:GT2 family glycosyltransferase